MNAPARNVRPAASKSASAACIFTDPFLKRNDMRLLSVVCATMMMEPVPSIPPGAFASEVTGADGCSRMLLSVTGLTTTLRINWNVHPVSSYGRGLAGE